jgi:hypothetical protein
MSDIEICLHGMKEAEDGTAMCSQGEASFWSVLVRQYLPEGVVEPLEDEDFATHEAAMTRAEELKAKYPNAAFEELA